MEGNGKLTEEREMGRGNRNIGWEERETDRQQGEIEDEWRDRGEKGGTEKVWGGEVMNGRGRGEIEHKGRQRRGRGGKGKMWEGA